MSFLMSCGNYEEFKEDPSSAFTQVAPSSALTFKEVQEQVLGPKCLRCHPGYSDYDTVNGSLQAIVAAVRTNRMPQDGPLSNEEKTILFSWVFSGAPRGDAPTPQQPTDPNILEPTYASISKNILGKKCVVCHNPQGRVPFLDLSTREAIWKQRNQLLNFEKPEESYILEVINDPFEPMPPLNSPFEQLTEEEKAVLTEWIAKGLP
ncbi:unnamed protein product [Chrysoparadoxa australica]